MKALMRAFVDVIKMINVTNESINMSTQLLRCEP
jgi:hypothetical protein